MQSVAEIYSKSIRPLGDAEKLELATLILEDVSGHKKNERRQNGGGSIRALFGSASLGYPTGADNESIDADLADEYEDTHEDAN